MAIMSHGVERRSPRRPNILVIFTDQERYAVHLPPMERPHFERLRRQAIEFTSHSCVDPVCSPARAVLLTGLYPHQSGVVENVESLEQIDAGFRAKVAGPALDPRHATIASVLAAAGYGTAWFGKWHLGPRTTACLARHGFAHAYVPEGEDNALLYDEPTAMQAVEWLMTRAESSPWLAFVSLVNPHDIHYERRWAHRVVPERSIAVPPNAADDLTRSPIPEVRQYATLQQRWALAKYGTWEQYRRRYCYLIEQTDVLLGRVLDALDRSGATADTLILYTSDHGDMSGAHGAAAKRFLYEESIHVPLLIVPPGGGPARTVRALTSHLDVAPTLAGVAGAEWPAPLRGRDLFAVSRDTGAGDDAVFGFSNFPPRTLPQVVADFARMVRAGRWKYVVYPSGGEQLFDLIDDPYEMVDRSMDPALRTVKQELSDRLIEESAAVARLQAVRLLQAGRRARATAPEVRQ